MPVRLPSRSLYPLRSAAVALACAALFAAGAVRAESFPAGSLIIPTQASYQDACGLVSAYGLIYEVLAANYYLKNTLNQPGITIHWVYRPGKKSPNRCVPTNLNPTPQTPGTCVAPFNGSSCGSTLPYQDTAWNDGCDFSISNTLAEPVRLVDNFSGNDVPSSPVGSFTTNNTATPGPLQVLSYPNYKGIKVQHTGTASSNVTAVQYSGGAFVIAAADAPNFLALLKGTTVANDFFGDPIDFKPFRTAGTCGVTVNNGVAEFTTAMPNPNTNTFANIHYVKIHRAMTAFSAEDTQKMSDVPGKIALLVTAGGQAGYSSSANGIKSDMLPAYLASAGLGSFKNAQGCSPTGYNAKNATANCPSPNRHGLIYDAFDVFDLQDSDVVAHTGPLEEQFVNARGDSKFYYQNLWVPHWEGSTFSVAGRTCDNKCINMARSSLRNVSNYRKVGVLAECGSLAVIEGAADVTDQASGGFWYPTVPAGGDTDGGIPDASVNSAAGQYSTKIATCGETSPDSGICLPGIATPALRGLLHEVNNNGIIGNVPLRNCTDPNMTSGSNCVYYPAPGDPFAQVGDQLWFPRYGLVSDFKPYNQSLYRPEFSPLAFTIPNLDTTQTHTLIHYSPRAGS